MQSVTSILESIVSTGDDIDELRLMGLESHNIDIAACYCLHTGKKIGTFESEELAFAIDDEISEDPESLVDALVVRCIASMRPSPALNKPDRVTLKALIGKRPVDGLAYLVNRLYGNRQTLRVRDETGYQFLIERVRVWNVLNSHSLNGVKLDAVTHWLLELDSKLNLHDMTPPMFELAKDKLRVTRTGTINLVDAMLFDGFTQAFESWVFDNLSDYDRQAKATAMQASYARGNQMTGAAFAQSWLDNPDLVTHKSNVLEARKPKQNAKATPSRKVSKLQSKVNAVSSLLDSILSAAEAKPAGETTQKKPVIVRAGALFANRIAKESN